MLRLSGVLLLVLSFCGMTYAAPPSQENWVDVMNRYAGTFQIMKEGSEKPAAEFTLKWAEPGKLLRYESQSSGDGPKGYMGGFCFWNEKENRVEFNEIDNADEGLMAVDGICLNATDTTATWLVTFWNKEGLVRQMIMVDTFTKDGIDRSITLLSGKALSSTTTNWVRVK